MKPKRKSRSQVRRPLPPDLRAEMKKALQKVAVEYGQKRGELRRACRVAVANARRERNEQLVRVGEDFEKRRATIRAEFEAKASERLLKSKVSPGT